MRDVNEPRNADARGDLGDAFGSLYMNIIIGKVSFAHGPQGQHNIHSNASVNILCLIVAANDVVHYVGVPDTLGNLFLVTDVPFLPKAAAIRVKNANTTNGEDRTYKGDDLSEIACNLQVALLVLVTVWYDNLRSCLRCVGVRYRADDPSSPKNTRTELGDEIAAEEARAAKDGRNVPCYRTASSRTLRNDRWSSRERE